MQPHDELATTKYCLANPRREYLVYQPATGQVFSVELKRGRYQLEWFNVSQGVPGPSGRYEAKDGAASFEAPFPGDAVLHLKILAE